MTAVTINWNICNNLEKLIAFSEVQLQLIAFSGLQLQLIANMYSQFQLIGHPEKKSNVSESVVEGDDSFQLGDDSFMIGAWLVT